jgi:hypothetical protein
MSAWFEDNAGGGLNKEKALLVTPDVRRGPIVPGAFAGR